MVTWPMTSHDTERSSRDPIRYVAEIPKIPNILKTAPQMLFSNSRR